MDASSAHVPRRTRTPSPHVSPAQFSERLAKHALQASNVFLRTKGDTLSVVTLLAVPVAVCHRVVSICVCVNKAHPRRDIIVAVVVVSASGLWGWRWS